MRFMTGYRSRPFEDEDEKKSCKYYAEYEGICCHGECPECADVCTYSDEQEKCEFYAKELKVCLTKSENLQSE